MYVTGHEILVLFVIGKPLGTMAGFKTYCSVSSAFIPVICCCAVNIFLLCAYERYMIVLKPLHALRQHVVHKLYLACWAAGFAASGLNAIIGGYALQERYEAALTAWTKRPTPFTHPHCRLRPKWPLL